MFRFLMKNKKRAVLTVACLLLITGVSVGGTVAYLMAKTDSLHNRFNPADVNCQVHYHEDGKAHMQNTGTVSAYVRATVVINWMGVDAEGNPLEYTHATAPVEGVDYQISYATEGWVKGPTYGFWYYTKPLEPGEVTPPLILGITCVTTPPEGYQLMAGVVGSAIQSEPAHVVQDAWRVVVNPDGTIAPT